MSIKREAAFHESGHAVAAFRSRFHRIVGPISLAEYGAGEVFISLSNSKLRAAGLPIDSSSQKIREVVEDLAVVLCAGLVAEQLAAKHDSSLKANPSCATPDHDLLRQQLSQAGLSKHFDLHEEAAKKILNDEWELVESLAAYLYSKISADPTEVIAFLEQQDQAAGASAQLSESPAE